MRVRLRLWLQIATVATAYASNGFLQSTLDKIQKERVDTMMLGSMQEENFTDYKGEIIFEEDERGTHPGEDFEFTYTNNVYEDQQAPISSEQVSTQTQQPPQTANLNGNNEGEIQGYYYYFYPLNHYVQSMANQPDVTPAKESDMMMLIMDSMMKNNMMTKSENKITPLFKAISWFIGTAMIFVVSILLLPKFRVKKAKGIFEDHEWWKKRRMEENMANGTATFRAHCSLA